MRAGSVCGPLRAGRRRPLLTARVWHTLRHSPVSNQHGLWAGSMPQWLQATRVCAMCASCHWSVGRACDGEIRGGTTCLVCGHMHMPGVRARSVCAPLQHTCEHTNPHPTPNPRANTRRHWGWAGESAHTHTLARTCMLLWLALAHSTATARCSLTRRHISASARSASAAKKFSRPAGRAHTHTCKHLRPLACGSPARPPPAHGTRSTEHMGSGAVRGWRHQRAHTVRWPSLPR